MLHLPTAALYQLNTRQFTPEGTLAAATAQLPRLRDLNVSIIWLMPIHEIGRRNRKGGLGSPYAVRDYYSVNAELGTLDDLKTFVSRAHALGLAVILDWVANHTAWDNPLVEQHPDWYARDHKGDFRPTPWWDWTDIIELDYRNDALRTYMRRAMRYWVEETDIDGYRCDVAGFVPTDFWEDVRRELETLKPIFMLAEWEARDLHRTAFDATYAWTWNTAVHRLCTGRTDLSELYVYYSWNERAWPADALRMTFTSNHDKNAWEGTMYEQFGPGLQAAIVLSVVGEGLPLLYNGQEAGNHRRLAFFERDPIVWREHAIGQLYRELFALQRREKALWHGSAGGRMIKLPNTAEDRLLTFCRRKEESWVVGAFNFSDRTVEAEVRDNGTGLVEAAGIGNLVLAPWAFAVFTRGGRFRAG